VGLGFYVLAEFWEILVNWQKAIFIYQMLMAFCGFMIALFTYFDEKEITYLYLELESLKRKLKEKEN
jgi:hypothetical protein